MSRKRLLVAALCAVIFAVLSAGSAFAGEVNGKGGETGAPANSNSICSYSGQNDDPEEPGAEGRVQSWGQDVQKIVHAGGSPPGGVPGVACQGGSNPRNP